MECGRVVVRGEGEGCGHGRAGCGDQPGVRAPWVRAVAGARGAAAAEVESGEGRGDSGEQHREAVCAAFGGKESVRSRADAEQAAEGEGGGRTADGGRDVGGTAVAAGVHRGGEGDGAFQRALQDRESDSGEAPYALVGAATQAAGGSAALDVGDEVRREGEGYDHCDAHLVQRAREGLEEAGRVGEGVRRAYADEESGEA